MNKKPYFNHEMTRVLKGVALLCMFMHHFFTFPEWREGYKLALIDPYSELLKAPLKICVPIFCFITGYTYFFVINKNYKYTFKKIMTFLVSYWFVMIPLVIITIYCTDYKYSMSEFFGELFGLRFPTMTFCWYVSFYCMLMLLFPLVAKFLGKRLLVDAAIMFIIFPVIFRVFRMMSHQTMKQFWDNMVIWYPIILSGYLTARYQIFEKIDRVMDTHIKDNWRIILYAFFSVIIPLSRIITLSISADMWNGKFTVSKILNLDFLTTIIFVYSAVNLLKLCGSVVRTVLSKIGAHSMMMWFVSCVYFNQLKVYTQKILYVSNNPILVVIIGTASCYLLALIFDSVINFILKSLLVGGRRCENHS